MLPLNRLSPFLFISLIACSKGDKVPAYIDIPAVQVATTQEQGSATSRITDAWVYANDELLGVWELPARVPVLKEGNVRISVAPGIKRNGMYDDRLRYPYYAWWHGDAQLTREVTTAVAPTVTYLPQTQFWIEAFEDPGTQLNVTPASDTTLLRFTPTTHPELLFVDGTPCGGFILDADRRYIRVYTNVQFAINGGPVFLEMDYRNDVLLTVGAAYTLAGVPQVTPYVIVSETRRSDGSMPWNKIHIDLSPIFNAQGVAQRDFYLEATLPSGRTYGEVYFDNLKLLRINQ